MGKLKTHSPIYCIMDNWENMHNLTHTLDKIYLTGVSLDLYDILRPYGPIPIIDCNNPYDNEITNTHLIFTGETIIGNP